ncbi:MAG TPA: hypothetical protein PLX69_12710 [Leptospiraceae bacterium]|nr:hypothetical protein [Leptospiraceae bacterium]HRG75413.1 hypothetical protein [Leptospiraceae bacterium]
MDSILLKAKQAELDIIYLNSLFRNYTSPKDKITYLIKKGDLISVKRGLYILSDEYKKSASRKILASMIYSPSYLSMQSALHFYGLIPESVYSEVSVTTKRTKTFKTPVGNFEYHSSSLKDFLWGLRFAKIDESRQIRIASPIKALYDLMSYSLNNLKKYDDNALLKYVELLRLDEDDFTISKEEYNSLNNAYYSRIKTILSQWIKEKRIKVKNARQY